MVSDIAQPEAVLTALARIDGTPFELFINEFASHLLEIDFIPLGGVHDGGADGFVVSEIFESAGGVFAQSSVRDDISTKIRQTIKRLREFGRDVTRLYYFTSHKVETIDKLEARLSLDLKCNINIRDASFISSKINSSRGTFASYKNHLEPILGRVGLSTFSNRKVDIDAPNVEACVFLSYEIDVLLGNRKFQESIIDSLIVWSLEGTDPDREIVLTKEQIAKRILESFPFSKQFSLGSLNHRLDELSTKVSGRDRSIKWHGKLKGYCLPFETRIAILEEHSRYEELLSSVRRELALLHDQMNLADTLGSDQLVALQLKVLEALFKHEGLKVAQSLDEKIEIRESTIEDIIEEAFYGENLSNSEALAARKFCLEATRRMIYGGSPDQKNYLSLLSRTYALLFLLRHEPRIVEYFQKMQSNYRLVVGGELIIRAISECGLPSDDRATESTFKILNSMGSELILCEHVLDEVISHIRATDFEYRNYYMEIDQFIKPEIASEINKILIRSYFYNKFESRVRSWGEFLDRIVPHSHLHGDTGRQALKTYLVNEYGFVFMDEESVSELVDSDEREVLTKEVMGAAFKDDIRLARNDVVNILMTYALRRKHGEASKGNPLGYRTWWLTEETRIQRTLKKSLAKKPGSAAMRPEFIIFCTSMLPSMKQVDSAYAGFLPSIHGVRIGHRVDVSVIKDMVERVKKVNAMSPGRVQAELEMHANRWQSEHQRQFLHAISKVEA